jgi:hypothetical protein
MIEPNTINKTLKEAEVEYNKFAADRPEYGEELRAVLLDALDGGLRDPAATIGGCLMQLLLLWSAALGERNVPQPNEHFRQPPSKMH